MEPNEGQPFIIQLPTRLPIEIPTAEKDPATEQEEEEVPGFKPLG